MAKYYKKVAVEKDWIQPVLTSNGVIGADNTDVMAIAQVSTGGTTINNPYNATDSAGFGQQHLNGGLIIDFKKPIGIRSLTFSSGSSNWDMPYKWTLYVSNNNINYTSIGQFSAVPCIINLPQKYRYIKMIVNNASTNGAHYFWSVANLKITGISSTVAWQECTKAEYDQLPADQRKIVTDIYNAFVRKKYLNKKPIETAWQECTKEEYDNSLVYYKKIVERGWTQPVLTSNGTLGGNSFAVQAYNTGNYGDPYKCFDGNNSSWWLTKGGIGNVYLTFYNPNPLKVQKLTIKNQGYSYDHATTAGNILGSNDGQNWSLIKSFTNNVLTYNAWWTLDLSNNTKYYSYYKIVPTSLNLPEWWGFSEIQIIATQQVETWQECTKEEYDLLPDSDRMVDSSNRRIENCYYTDAITSLKNMSIIKEPVTDYVTVSEGVASATGVQKLTDAQALSIINGEYVWTRIYNNNIGIVTYTFKDNIALSSFSFTTGWNGDGLAYPSSLKWEALVNGSWVSVYNATASEGGWAGNRANRTINVNSNVFSNTYRFSIGGYNITLGGIPYYDWIQDLKLNVIKKIVIGESKSVFIDSNIQTVGTLAIDNNGIASGFSNANYCKLPKAFAPANSDTWEWQIAIKLSSTQTGGALCGMYAYRDWIHGGGLDGYVYYTGSNGLYIDVSKSSVGAYIRTPTSAGQGQDVNATYIAYCNANITIENDRLYKIKVNHSGLDNTYTLYIIEEDDTVHTYPFTNGARYGIAMPSAQTQFGMWVEGNYAQSDKAHAFDGKIDLLNSYIKVNNQLWWTNKQISKSGLIVTNYLAGVNSEMKEVVVERVWEQPIATQSYNNDNTKVFNNIGGNTFAVQSANTHTAATMPLYYAFDNNDSTNFNSGNSTTQWIKIYHPQGLKISNISFINNLNNFSGTIKACNDDLNYIQLASFSKNKQNKSIDVNSNNFYKYYLMTYDDINPNQYGWHYTALNKFKIIATEQVKQWVPE